MRAAAKVSMGRIRLPPELMRWPASSGIIRTWLRRARIASLTLAMSPASSVVNGSIRRSADLSSSGTRESPYVYIPLPDPAPRPEHGRTYAASEPKIQVPFGLSLCVRNDLVLDQRHLESILKAERVAYFVADQNMAAVGRGRLAFCRDAFWLTLELEGLARRLIVEAGLGKELLDG